MTIVCFLILLLVILVSPHDLIDVYSHSVFLGPKALAGFAPTDNGFARFNRVRIPKENMLSGFAQVTDEGKYLKPPHAKLSYGGVSQIKCFMPNTSLMCHIDAVYSSQVSLILAFKGIVVELVLAAWSLEAGG